MNLATIMHAQIAYRHRKLGSNDTMFADHQSLAAEVEQATEKKIAKPERQCQQTDKIDPSRHGRTSATWLIDHDVDWGARLQAAQHGFSPSPLAASHARAHRDHDTNGGR